MDLKQLMKEAEQSKCVIDNGSWTSAHFFSPYSSITKSADSFCPCVKNCLQIRLRWYSENYKRNIGWFSHKKLTYARPELRVI